MKRETLENVAGRFRKCAKVDLYDKLQPRYKHLGSWWTEGKLPIVYHPIYNISFYGLENLHVFDSKKYGRIVKLLEDWKVIKKSQLLAPNTPPPEILLDVHTEEYVRDLETSPLKIARVVELGLIALLPNRIVQRHMMVPMRTMVSGTMLTLGLAAMCGWAINIGGGMHHASHNQGQGWCAYDDIYLAVRQLRRATGGTIQRVLVIDLDVHQGNGLARDKLHFQDDDFIIMDVYNSQLFPWDTYAKSAIDIHLPLASYCTDEQYIARVRQGIDKAHDIARPDMIVYNAGTDVYYKDPLGHLEVTEEGILKRDELVFGLALDLGVPIAMVQSGGYARENYKVVSSSLKKILSEHVGLEQDIS